MDSLNDMWSAVCECAKEKYNVNSEAFKLWFTPITLKSFDGQKAVLSINNNFLFPIIEKKYSELINNAFNEVIGFNVEIEFTLEQLTDEKVEQKANDSGASLRTLGDNFDNFVVGKSNNYAYAAAKKVAEDPGKSYNPLYIYGKSGLGKTHLLKAIENEMKSRNPEAKIIYITSENFTNDLVYHLRNKTMYEFREKYRNCDALLMDDIQFIAQKEQTEEEFFHTFNELTEYGKQIVMTSDRSPNEIQILQERLKTRFEWGLMVDIQPPDFETRMAIIKNKAEQYDFSIPDEIVEFFAQEVKNNVRQLESAVKKIKSLCLLSNAKPTLDIAKEAIKELTTYNQPISVINSKITETVGNTYGISVENIMSDKRDKNIKDARQISMYIIREITGMSLEDIGKYFGGKTHSTVKHSIDKVRTMMDDDFQFKKTVEDIIKNVKDY
jgi:chromosomal replication initiator protein